MERNYSCNQKPSRTAHCTRWSSLSSDTKSSRNTRLLRISSHFRIVSEEQPLLHKNKKRRNRVRGFVGPGAFLTEDEVDGYTMAENTEQNFVVDHSEELNGTDTRDLVTMLEMNSAGLKTRSPEAQSTDVFLHLDGPCELTVDRLQEFVLCPAGRSTIIQCRIKRRKQLLRTTYYLYLEREGGEQILLLTAQKRKKSKTSNYVISTDPTDQTKKGAGFVGKLRANALGTAFTLYDKGQKPVRTGLLSRDQIRQELAAICYDVNLFGFQGPRKITVILPGMDETRKRIVVQPWDASESILSKWQAQYRHGLLELQNNPPIWNNKIKRFTLNFRGRVKKPSVKNFQIIQSSEPNNILMQFGKVAENEFSMDYRYPFCVLQAFAIVLSNFDSKLLCD
ncbi:tubby protein isoform X1 [Callorhinchus milii]|uniref:tubby protein isoform X1 n=1 Tax=Callorhinchus milii TaxID=7868 RepID=UPI001C3FB6A5|nr:tubby protein isoform X1 [Callorhinchus milii]